MGINPNGETPVRNPVRDVARTGLTSGSELGSCLLILARSLLLAIIGDWGELARLEVRQDRADILTW